jgi:type I restriction enzyme M protein
MAAHNKDIPAEKVLFGAADQLRGSVESAEYKHLVLGLVFLKYVSDAFAAKREQVEARFSDPDGDGYIEDADDRAEALEDRDEYESENVFWVPKESRWEAVLALGSQPQLGVELDRALDRIEQENHSLRGVLPHVYAKASIPASKLGELVLTVAKIGFGDDPDQARDVLGRVYEYFIKEFARAEGHRGGEFYTPANVVRLLVELLQPALGISPRNGHGGVRPRRFRRRRDLRVGQDARHRRPQSQGLRRAGVVQALHLGNDGGGVRVRRRLHGGPRQPGHRPPPYRRARAAGRPPP